MLSPPESMENTNNQFRSFKTIPITLFFNKTICEKNEGVLVQITV